jgi:hypothetical protein
MLDQIKVIKYPYLMFHNIMPAALDVRFPRAIDDYSLRLKKNVNFVSREVKISLSLTKII